MKNKEHLTPKGLHLIMSIRASMNKGISSELLKYFNNEKKVIPVSKPLVDVINTNHISPDYVGFTDAEGCFFINIRVNKNGYWVSAGFSLVQHSRDLLLFKTTKEFLGYGTLVEEKIQMLLGLKLIDFVLLVSIFFLFCSLSFTEQLKILWIFVKLVL